MDVDISEYGQQLARSAVLPPFIESKLPIFGMFAASFISKFTSSYNFFFYIGIDRYRTNFCTIKLQKEKYICKIILFLNKHWYMTIIITMYLFIIR